MSSNEAFSSRREKEPENLRLRSTEEYKRLLDPEGVLPKVKILFEGNSYEHGWGEPAEKYQITMAEIQNEEGATIGKLGLVQYSPSDILDRQTKAELDIIEIEEKYRGKNFGKAAYLDLIQMLSEDNIRLISARSLSREGEKIWNWLVEKGVARLIQQGRYPESPGKFGYVLDSKYEII